MIFCKPDAYLAFGALPMPRIVETTIPGAPEYLHGLRILFVSDLHFSRYTPAGRCARLKAQMAALRPDLLLLGGDYAEDYRGMVRFLGLLAGVPHLLGAYGVPGNNDYELDSGLEFLSKKTNNAGLPLLVNESIPLALPGGTLYIGGCDDYKHGHPDTRRIFPEADGYRILLSHYPVLPECRVDLMLSGHTHGGQFNFFGLSPYTLGYERKRRLCALSGLHRFDRTQVLVSNGVGVSKLPLRIGAEPQLHLLKFGR